MAGKGGWLLSDESLTDGVVCRSLYSANLSAFTLNKKAKALHSDLLYASSLLLDH
jgi:hypothetical protein